MMNREEFHAILYPTDRGGPLYLNTSSQFLSGKYPNELRDFGYRQLAEIRRIGCLSSMCLMWAI